MSEETAGTRRVDRGGGDGRDKILENRFRAKRDTRADEMGGRGSVCCGSYGKKPDVRFKGVWLSVTEQNAK